MVNNFGHAFTNGSRATRYKIKIPNSFGIEVNNIFAFLVAFILAILCALLSFLLLLPRIMYSIMLPLGLTFKLCWLHWYWNVDCRNFKMLSWMLMLNAIPASILSSALCICWYDVDVSSSIHAEKFPTCQGFTLGMNH